MNYQGALTIEIWPGIFILKNLKFIKVRKMVLNSETAKF